MCATRGVPPSLGACVASRRQDTAPPRHRPSEETRGHMR
ncbi:hypothetical protein FM119_09365 [Mycetocola reblochoni REB411]|uniref:Uncharacterized protein n=1 Tax=Mycetocola reblochoni REB411 TaxID=1255698 RepID=A0A1R4JTG6_9MICO|nr:hypothetical protein FM119_09365 [Mycetocola reblochoni REB411]